MILATALVAVLLFAAGLYATAIGKTANRAVSASVEGVSAILDRDLSEDEKEKRVQSAALALLSVAWGIAWRFALALGAAALPLALSDAIGLAAMEDVFALMLRLDFLIIVSVVMGVAVWLLLRLTRKEEQEKLDDSAYSAGDRLVHSFAFSSPRLMKRLARRDDRRAAREVGDFQSQKPIFVTSLARGGTTALLNAMAEEPALASLTYRDMPFVTAPLSWSRWSSSNRAVKKRDRAHGDGIQIDLNSAEAFDEVYWMLGWPEKYHKARIDLWDLSDDVPEPRALIENAFQRVAYLRARERGRTDAPMHYLSKNNANVARIDLLKQFYPESGVVIALRHPGAHALSLFRQDQRFAKVHEESPFTKRYMRDIGHFEFGPLHKPLAFPGFDPEAHDRGTPDYWLSYWIAAFRHIATRRAQCLFVSQDKLRTDPNGVMGGLFERLAIPPEQSDFAPYFRPTPDTFDAAQMSPDLLRTATELFADLEKDAI